MQRGWTPLYHASKQGRNDLIQLLIEHGAVVDLPSDVSLCYMYNALHILTPITDCKFLYPIQNEWGVTPLIGACIGGNATTAALLIEKGAKVNYINKVRLLTSLLVEMLYSRTKVCFPCWIEYCLCK